MENLQRELAELKAELDNRLAQWENEKACVEKLSKIREEIDETGNQIQIAQREGDYEKAAELSYGKLPSLKQQLEIEEVDTEYFSIYSLISIRTILFSSSNKDAASAFVLCMRVFRKKRLRRSFPDGQGSRLRS